MEDLITKTKNHYVNRVEGSKSFDIPAQIRTKIVIYHVLSVSKRVILGYIVHWGIPEWLTESRSWQTITYRDIGLDILRDRTVVICKTCMVNDLHCTHYRLSKKRRSYKHYWVSSLDLCYLLSLLKLGAWRERGMKSL